MLLTSGPLASFLRHVVAPKESISVLREEAAAVLRAYDILGGSALVARSYPVTAAEFFLPMRGWCDKNLPTKDSSRQHIVGWSRCLEYCTAAAASRYGTVNCIFCACGPVDSDRWWEKPHLPGLVLVRVRYNTLDFDNFGYTY